MGTEVMRPHDCLIQRLAPFHRRKIGCSAGSGNAAFFPRYRKPVGRAEKKRHNAGTKRSPSVENLETGELVMGRVTILRRGESLDSLNTKIHKPVPAPVNSINGEGLGRIRVSHQFGDVYAGSAFSNSPSPRAVPLPSFFSNIPNPKQDGFDDSATRHLRRMLGLE